MRCSSDDEEASSKENPTACLFEITYPCLPRVPLATKHTDAGVLGNFDVLRSRAIFRANEHANPPKG